MKGTIYQGINNIYDVRSDHDEPCECRIKGKKLGNDPDTYNPLAPGDRVEYEYSDSGKGLIISRLNRENRFARWNRKRDAWQVIAANIDLILIVISPQTPPFRPRFVDRVLIAAAQGYVTAAVLVNKIDQGIDARVSARMVAWENIDIKVMKCSAKNGEGLEALKTQLNMKTVVLFGPSGTGKSTIINALIPGLELATGQLSLKHDRGCHITNYGRLLDTPWGGRLVDTPGVREILVRGITPEDLPHWFPEFGNQISECSFHPCSHQHEPGCGVLKAVEDGFVDSDRYANYVRIRRELENESRW